MNDVRLIRLSLGVCALSAQYALLACSEMTYVPPDQGPISAGYLYKGQGGTSDGGALGGEEAGVEAGVSAGMHAGHLTAGAQSGAQAGSGASPIGGDQLTISDWGVGGQSTVSALQCGEMICDEHARCMGSAGQLSCVCEPRYEGDGQTCTPQPCPEHASGAPACACEEGYEGYLTYELGARAWMGQCLSLDRACDEGELVQTSCGVGACRTQGVSRCEEGAWVEYCEPLESTSDEDLCDGLDEDCDGTFDEDFSPEVTTCGQGACEATGLLSCEQGRVLDSCRSADEIGEDSTCDRVDDDCDGQYDEAYEPLLVSCGEGVCATSGRVVCEAGNTQVLCAPSNPSGDDADCDGLDNDCDGATDESFVGVPVTCGVGACLFDGLTRCINGVTQEECVPGEPGEDDLSCDGVDDDCDGRADEGYEEGVTSCGVGVCVATGRAWCEGGEELSECVEGTPTGDDSSCNGVDEDCDGLLDESYVSELVACDGAGDYACPVRAETSCVNANVTYDCEAAIATQEDASCDGVDDDCDGALDEAYVSVEVTCGLGVCSDTSTTSCVEGVVTDRCVERSPSGDDSDCDGRDDDCDGLVDESFVEGPISCGRGVCVAQGVSRCVEGEHQVDCSPSAPIDPNEAACDGLDNDCDGRVDEAYLSTPNVCGDGVCFARGSSSCAQGVEQMNCAPLPATGDDADCDGLDNDCDASADEDYPPVVDACGVGVCFNTADSSCVEGAVQNNCVELLPTGNDADCDALDNDCDGSNDEDYPPQIDACGVGVCASSAPSSCVAGAVINNCVELQPTGNDADCDGLDNDCDGSSDEDYPPETDSCGVGVCFNTASSSCVGGQRQNNCVELQPTGDDSVCNGLDDDCDGLVDEGYVPTSTFCTFGTICVEEGFKECVNGQLVDVCDPPAHYTGSDASCNGQDNDCDGRTDEAYSGGLYYCGTGVCRRSAFKSCVNGVESDDGCVQGQPNGNDTVCDGDDNDCDGSTDESFTVTGSSCGTGACASTGAYTCVGGSVRDSCRERDPTGDDTDNDGVDDDCDGQADEDYVPATPDTVCDGIDSDQDGSVDEAVPVTASSCGEGACASTGTVTCVNGSLIDSCSEDLSQQSADTTCDGVDDDCDGSTDEAYVGGSNSCGVGACERTGSFVCSGGQVSSNCVEGQPSPDTTNDGVDDDCDGAIDEAAVSCSLITIPPSAFIFEPFFHSVGTTIYRICIGQGGVDNEYYRWSFLAGDVYYYEAAGGSNTSCVSDPPPATSSSWSYAGGTISADDLYDTGIDYTEGACSYDVIATDLFFGREVGTVYLAPK